MGSTIPLSMNLCSPPRELLKSTAPDLPRHLLSRLPARRRSRSGFLARAARRRPFPGCSRRLVSSVSPSEALPVTPARWRIGCEPACGSRPLSSSVSSPPSSLPHARAFVSAPVCASAHTAAASRQAVFPLSLFFCLRSQAPLSGCPFSLSSASFCCSSVPFFSFSGSSPLQQSFVAACKGPSPPLRARAWACAPGAPVRTDAVCSARTPSRPPFSPFSFWSSSSPLQQPLAVPRAPCPFLPASFSFASSSVPSRCQRAKSAAAEQLRVRASDAGRGFEPGEGCRGKQARDAEGCRAAASRPSTLSLGFASESSAEARLLHEALGASLSSPGIPGDAFVEFTTESVRAMNLGASESELADATGESRRRPTDPDWTEKAAGDPAAGCDGEETPGEKTRRRGASGKVSRIKVFSLSAAHHRAKRPPTELDAPSASPLFSPIPDDQLFSLSPNTLNAQELLYVLGRASLILRDGGEGRRETEAGGLDVSGPRAPSYVPVAATVSSSPSSSAESAAETTQGPSVDARLSSTSWSPSWGLFSPDASSSASSSPPYSARQLSRPGAREGESLSSPDFAASGVQGALFSPRGFLAQTDFERAQLRLWTHLMERLTSLLPSLKPREFTRAVQTLGYARPVLLELAREATLSLPTRSPASDRQVTGHANPAAASRSVRSQSASRSFAFSACESMPRCEGGTAAGGREGRTQRETRAHEERKREAEVFLKADRYLVLQLRRQAGLRATAFHGECLARIFYGMTKGQMENNEQFLDFLTSEVLERLDKKLRPWQLHRIFQAAFNSPHVSRHFKAVLGSHLVARLAFLPGQSLADFLPKCTEIGLTKKIENVVKINVICGKRLRAWEDPSLLISLGYPLVMCDLISPSNVVALFRQLRLRVNFAYPSLDAEQVRSHEADYRRAVRNVNAALVPLKLMEARLRVFRPNVYEILSPSLRAWLATVREAPLKLTSFLPPADQAHVNAPLLLGLAELIEETNNEIRHPALLLHPHLQGPFLLETASPLTKTFLEWDTPWLFYPPFKRFESRVYTETKRRCLAEEGWELVALSAEEYLALPDASSKKRWLINEMRTKLLLAQEK
ncbi:hypothetical protein BESB_040480 [Besnoitia besnoiti]|uniref:RAP domain-containing protein n=1 Tax=Besnoitia besnoiti TaxID=94643 RepID=A0A2A9MP73_BESBE|nr:hypothetical protein BESB_040480 [Besnoitia besnoiti]PFH37590.1 hypothetical protein BESB_040480 [Besnoitia besnoiti]